MKKLQFFLFFFGCMLCVFQLQSAAKFDAPEHKSHRRSRAFSESDLQKVPAQPKPSSEAIAQLTSLQNEKRRLSLARPPLVTYEQHTFSTIQTAVAQHTEYGNQRWETYEALRKQERETGIYSDKRYLPHTLYNPDTQLQKFKDYKEKLEKLQNPSDEAAYTDLLRDLATHICTLEYELDAKQEALERAQQKK